MRGALTLAFVLLTAGVAGCTESNSSLTEPATENPAAAPFSSEKTLSCLRNGDAIVNPLRSSDPQLRALADLAQRRSFEVHADGTVIAIAFARDVAAAQLLVELLSVPGGTQEAVRRGNVVVLRYGNGSLSASVARCLRD